MKTNLFSENNQLYRPQIIRSVMAAEELISENVGNHISLHALARHVGINEFILKRGFKDIFRTTIYQYLLKRRMSEAVKLLYISPLKEKDIAKKCGFKTLSGFITTFKKHYTKTPKIFRQQLRQKLSLPIDTVI